MENVRQRVCVTAKNELQFLALTSDLDFDPPCAIGARPADPEQAAQPVAQQEEAPVPEQFGYPALPVRYTFRYDVNPTVIEVKARVLEKIFGPRRAFLPRFQQDFRVQVQMGQRDPEGKVEIRIMGNPSGRHRAKKMIDFLIANSGRMAYVGSLMLSVETIKYLKSKCVHYRISRPAVGMERQAG